MNERIDRIIEWIFSTIPKLISFMFRDYVKNDMEYIIYIKENYNGDKQ